MSDVFNDPNPRPLFKLNGAAASDDLLDNMMDARVELPLNAPARATLRFFDEHFNLLDNAGLDIAKALSVSFERPDGTLKVVFDGEITGIAIEQGPTGQHEMIVTALDQSHRLGRATTTTTYLQQKYSDIFSTLIQQFGMQADVQGLGTNTLPYVLQTTDAAAFLTEICRRAGAQWRVDGKKLSVFKPPQTASPVATLTWGDDLARFRTRFAPSESADSVVVRGWDPASKAAISATAASSTPAFLSTAPLATGGRSKAKQFGSAARSTNGTLVTSQAEAQLLADSFSTRAASVEIVARGETAGNPSIVPGSMVTIAGVGTKLAGNYYVTEVDHVFSTRGFSTRFVTGSMTPSTIGDLAGSRTGTGHLGAVIGVVSNIDDPDGAGRVKVKFPSAGDNIESDWARIVMPASGNARGFLMFPSVDDEVLVMFEQGDTRRAFVVGGVWNGKDKTPMAKDNIVASGQVKQWGMVTPGGHSLLFRDDEAGKERLDIIMKDGKTKLSLGQSSVELIANQKPLKIESGLGSIVISDQGDVTIKGNKVTIQATQDLKMSGLNVEANAQTGMKVVGGTTTEVSANAQLSLKSSGVTEVKGTMVKVN